MPLFRAPPGEPPKPSFLHHREVAAGIWSWLPGWIKLLLFLGALWTGVLGYEEAMRWYRAWRSGGRILAERRRAGIPDEDHRPFHIAKAAADAARGVTVEEGGFDSRSRLRVGSYAAHGQPILGPNSYQRRPDSQLLRQATSASRRPSVSVAAGSLGHMAGRTASSSSLSRFATVNHAANFANAGYSGVPRSGSSSTLGRGSRRRHISGTAAAEEDTDKVAKWRSQVPRSTGEPKVLANSSPREARGVKRSATSYPDSAASCTTDRQPLASNTSTPRVSDPPKRSAKKARPDLGISAARSSPTSPAPRLPREREALPSLPGQFFQANEMDVDEYDNGNIDAPEVAASEIDGGRSSLTAKKTPRRAVSGKRKKDPEVESEYGDGDESMLVPVKKQLRRRGRTSDPGGGDSGRRRGTPAKVEVQSLTPKRSLQPLFTAGSTSPKRESTPETENGGKEVVNSAGERFSIGADGLRRKLVKVLQRQKRYSMPADSSHPDAQAEEVKYVDTWVTPDEFKALRKEGKLEGQDSLPEDDLSPDSDSSVVVYMSQRPSDDEDPLWTASRTSSRANYSRPPSVVGSPARARSPRSKSRNSLGKMRMSSTTSGGTPVKPGIIRGRTNEVRRGKGGRWVVEESSPEPEGDLEAKASVEEIADPKPVATALIFGQPPVVATDPGAVEETSPGGLAATPSITSENRTPNGLVSAAAPPHGKVQSEGDNSAHSNSQLSFGPDAPLPVMPGASETKAPKTSLPSLFSFGHSNPAAEPPAGVPLASSFAGQESETNSAAAPTLTFSFGTSSLKPIGPSTPITGSSFGSSSKPSGQTAPTGVSMSAPAPCSFGVQADDSKPASPASFIFSPAAPPSSSEQTKQDSSSSAAPAPGSTLAFGGAPPGPAPTSTVESLKTGRSPFSIGPQPTSTVFSASGRSSSFALNAASATSAQAKPDFGLTTLTSSSGGGFSFGSRVAEKSSSPGFSPSAEPDGQTKGPSTPAAATFTFGAMTSAGSSSPAPKVEREITGFASAFSGVGATPTSAFDPTASTPANEKTSTNPTTAPAASSEAPSQIGWEANRPVDVFGTPPTAVEAFKTVQKTGDALNTVFSFGSGFSGSGAPGGNGTAFTFSGTASRDAEPTTSSHTDTGHPVTGSALGRVNSKPEDPAPGTASGTSEGTSITRKVRPLAAPGRRVLNRALADVAKASSRAPSPSPAAEAQPVATTSATTAGFSFGSSANQTGSKGSSFAFGQAEGVGPKTTFGGPSSEPITAAADQKAAAQPSENVPPLSPTTPPSTNTAATGSSSLTPTSTLLPSTTAAPTPSAASTVPTFAFNAAGSQQPPTFGGAQSGVGSSATFGGFGPAPSTTFSFGGSKPTDSGSATSPFGSGLSAGFGFGSAAAPSMNFSFGSALAPKPSETAASSTTPAPPTFTFTSPSPQPPSPQPDK